MGVAATSALQARRRATLARINRQIAARDATDPQRVSHKARITAAAHDARRALRAAATAKRARHRAETEAATALRRLLVGEGLSRPDIAALMGLSTSTVTRLLRMPVASTDANSSECSTDIPPDHSRDGGPADREPSDTSSGAAEKGNR